VNFFKSKIKQLSQEEDSKLLFCSQMEHRFTSVNQLPLSSNIFFSDNQQELFSYVSKLILFYSNLILLVSRNRNGGTLIISLISHFNDEIQKLANIYQSPDSKNEDFHILISAKVSKALLTLNLCLEIMNEVERKNWIWFKDEKRYIADFLSEEFEGVTILQGAV